MKKIILLILTIVIFYETGLYANELSDQDPDAGSPKSYKFGLGLEWGGYQNLTGKFTLLKSGHLGALVFYEKLLAGNIFGLRPNIGFLMSYEKDKTDTEIHLLGSITPGIDIRLYPLSYFKIFPEFCIYISPQVGFVKTKLKKRVSLNICYGLEYELGIGLFIGFRFATAFNIKGYNSKEEERFLISYYGIYLGYNIAKVI